MNLSRVVKTALCLLLPGVAMAGGNNLRRVLGDDNDAEAPTGPQPVMVEVWTKPVLDWDLETGLGDGPNLLLLQTLKEVKMGLGDAVDFDMNMYINSGDGVCSELKDKNGDPLEDDVKKQVCDDSCANNHRYCEPPPSDPKHRPLVKGIQLLAESLRRQCIWRMVHKKDDWDSTNKYFDYVASLRKIECDSKGYRKLCIQNVLQTIRVGGNPVRNCASNGGGIDGDNPNTIFDTLIAMQSAKRIDKLTTLPAVFVAGELQTNATATSILSAVCQKAPKELRPDDVCSDIPDAIGADSDPKEEAKVEEKLESEIAQELGETPEDVKGENASELEDKLEKEEEKDGGANPEDEEKLAQEVGTQDETELVDQEKIEEEEQALEKVEAEDAKVKFEEPKPDQVKPIVEIWTTPLLDWSMGTPGEDGLNIKLFGELSPVVTTFGLDIDFRPQYYLFSQAEICTVDEKGNQMSQDDSDKCADTNCANNRRYCGFGPDDWKVTGKGMIEESLRRMCIWEEYGRDDQGHKAKVYFDYLTEFHSHKCDQSDDIPGCIGEVFKIASVDAHKVDACIVASGGVDVDAENGILEPLLKLQKATFFFHKLNPMNLPFVIIDNEPLPTGAEVTAEVMFSALCAKFTSDPKPPICENGAVESLLQSLAASGLATSPTSEETPTEPVPPSDSATTVSPAPSGSPSSSPSLAPSGPTSEGGNEETPVESEAPQTTEAAPVVTEESESPQEVTAETSSPKTPWGIMSSQETSTTAPLVMTESPAVEKAGETEEKTNAIPITLDTTKMGDTSNFDMAVFDKTLSSLGVLNKCDVDTNAVMNKVMALAGGNLKQEMEKIKTDLPMLMSKTCPRTQGEEILRRMEAFHRCSKFNLQALIETFPSTATGVAMRCANAYSNMTKEEEEKGFIPEACIRTVEADSVLGRGIFALYLYPDVACPCFENLGERIPECTADVWPIPINGALVKVQSCLVGQYCQTIDGLCEKSLESLNSCLPSVNTPASDFRCDDIFSKCSAVYDSIPPMLTAAPLPDACVRISEGSKFYGTHIVERYDVFRHTCGKNIELWEGHTPVAEFKAFVQQGVMGIDYKSVPFISGAGAGFLAGIAFTIAFIIVRRILIWICSCLRRCCCCCCGGGRKKPQRPKSKDYATVETETDEIPEPEYRD